MMSSTYCRLAAIRDYWMPRDTSARIEVRVTDLDEVLRELVRVITISAPQPAPAASGEPPLFRQYIDQQVATGMAPLYAAFDTAQPAPARVPLTDEQIQELSQQHKFDSRMEKFVRIIERAHGIGTPAKES